MTLAELRVLNPDVALYGVDDPEFAPFGRRISGVDTSEIVSVAEGIPYPETGTLYEASVPEFERLEIAKIITDRFFGTLPAQTGYCHGRSNKLNGWEWHTSSEINVAVTDLVLILGHVWDLENGKIDSSKAKAFLLNKGDMVEVYATSLHFCPCMVGDGFGCVVALPAGTNVPLEEPSEDPLLFRKNKWIIAHNENQALIDRGVVPGICGENIEIRGN